MDELAKQLAAFLATIKPGMDWAIEQAPLVVQEKILYGRVIHTAFVGMGLVGVPAAFYFARWSVGRLRATESDDAETVWIFATLSAVVAEIVCSVMLFVNWQDAIMVWVAPRLYILKWIAEMVK